LFRTAYRTRVAVELALTLRMAAEQWLATVFRLRPGIWAASLFLSTRPCASLSQAYG
jgi:hypothetical protein